MKALLNFFRKYALAILLIFHAVGFVGISFFQKEFFAALTPMNLLLSTFLLVICHAENRYSSDAKSSLTSHGPQTPKGGLKHAARSPLVGFPPDRAGTYGHCRGLKSLFTLFLATFILGYLAELLGTQTGFPFGDYEYGPALGPQLWEVPVIIGVNWFLMVSSSGFLAKKLVKPSWLQVLLAAALMTLTDLAIEPVAPLLDYWYWAEGQAPLLNYAGWLAVSILMQVIFQKTVAHQHNQLAIPYYITVSAFFVLLNLTL